MHLCLSCRFVSPAGSLLCGRCGRSFGGRLCPRHHLSPAGSQFCVQCGKKELTASTLFLPLGCLSRMLGWAMALLLLGVLSHHGGGLVGSLWSLACWFLLHLLNLSPCVIVQGAMKAVTWLLALLILSWFLPKAVGARLRGALLETLPWAGRTACRLARGFGRWLYHRVEGAPATSEKTEKKKTKH